MQGASPGEKTLPLRLIQVSALPFSLNIFAAATAPEVASEVDSVEVTAVASAAVVASEVAATSVAAETTEATDPETTEAPAAADPEAAPLPPDATMTEEEAPAVVIEEIEELLLTEEKYGRRLAASARAPTFNSKQTNSSVLSDVSNFN